MSRFKFGKKKKDKINFLSDPEINRLSVINNTRTEIFSNREITVEGCQGVAEYKDDFIKLKVKKGELLLNGDSFFISLFDNKTVTVTGEISSIEFCYRGKND